MSISTNNGLVLKQTRSNFENVSVVYNRFKKDYCTVLFIIMVNIRQQKKTL